MRIMRSLLALLGSTSLASAETDKTIDVAIATNAPLRWDEAKSMGASGYVGIATNHAIRVNVASYTAPTNFLLTAFRVVVLDDEPGDTTEAGRITDLGIGYQYYPRRVFHGLTLEAGLLTRHVDVRVDRFNDEEVDTKGTGVAARALVGWSWLLWQRLFVSTAIGASVGRYTGTERRGFHDEPVMTSDFVRYDTALEAYLRIGVAFGL